MVGRCGSSFGHYHRASQPPSSPSCRAGDLGFVAKTKKTSQPQQPQRLDPVGLANLFVVYLVWSSTYLAIRIAVREGAGFPPFTMGFMRAALGGAILLLWSRLRKQPIRLTKQEAVILGASGMLLWLGGNGLGTLGGG